MKQYQTPNPGRFKRKAKFEVMIALKYLWITAALIVGSWLAGIAVGKMIIWVIRL